MKENWSFWRFSMAISKISMMDAYMIESLRSNGILNEQIVNTLENKNIEAWENITPKFDYQELIELYHQDTTAFKSALQEGYTIKFLTMNGLKNLLKMKYDKIAERDYLITDNGIQQLKINEGDLQSLQQLLSINWKLKESLNTIDSTVKEVDIEIS